MITPPTCNIDLPCKLLSKVQCSPSRRRQCLPARKRVGERGCRPLLQTASGNLPTPVETRYTERRLHGERCFSPGEHLNQRQRTCFIKTAEASTAERGEARRWSTEQASARAEPCPASRRGDCPSISQQMEYFRIFVHLCRAQCLQVGRFSCPAPCRASAE